MLRKILIVGALAFWHSPAGASEVYGPEIPAAVEPYRKVKEAVLSDPAADPAAAKRRAFNHWRYAGWGMAVADIASTQRCLKKRTCEEGNPLYGKNPSLGKMVAIRLPLEIAIDYGLRELFKTNPDAALRAVQIKTIGTGVVVGLNMRF